MTPGVPTLILPPRQSLWSRHHPWTMVEVRKERGRGLNDPSPCHTKPEGLHHHAGMDQGSRVRTRVSPIKDDLSLRPLPVFRIHIFPSVCWSISKAFFGQPLSVMGFFMWEL
jgi:hypothetical protein